MAKQWNTEAYRRYNQSDKGKDARCKYNQSDAYAQISKRYNKSPRGKEVRKAYRDRWYRTLNGRIHAMWAAAKRRAERRDIEFTLKRDDIVIPPWCPLLPIKIEIENYTPHYNSPSLDRKDPSVGYTKENTWVISSRANMLKNDATVEELEDLIAGMVRNGVGI